MDFGYVLARPYWGKQIMAEALGAVVEWWAQQEGVERLTATCHPDNLRSARVLEKVGMKREGVLSDHHVYPALSSERRDAVCYARVL